MLDPIAQQINDKLSHQYTKKLIDDWLAQSKHEDFTVLIETIVPKGEIRTLDRQEGAYVCFHDEEDRSKILGSKH